MYKHSPLIVIIVFLNFISLQAQTPPYYHYTSSDGLASSTVFDAIQDKDGYMWFGTLNGLSRFDGKHFTTYNVNSGLNSPVITSLVEGDNGEIYIGNYEKGINVFKNNRLENYRSKINGKNFNTTYLSKHRGKIYSYTGFGFISVTDKDESTPDYFLSFRPSILYRLAKLFGDNLVALTSNGLYSIKDRELEKINITGLPDTDFYCMAERSDGSYFVGSIGSVYHIKYDRVIKKYSIDLYRDKRFYVMHCDKKDNIWFSVLGKGFYLIPYGSDKIIDLGSKLGLENTQIDDFLEDSEGNMWICTFGKGVYCLNNLYLRNYTEKDGLNNNNIICIEKDKSGKTIIGTINGISILENGIIYKLKDKSGKILSGYINSIKCFDDYVYVCWAAETPEIKNIFYKGLKFRFLINPSFSKTDNNFYVYGGSGNDFRILKEYKTNTKEIRPDAIFGDSVLQNRVNAVMGDSKNNIWFGTSLGLCKLTGVNDNIAKTNWKKTFFPDDAVLSSKINSIYCDNMNRVWFTGVNGIANFNLENNSFTSYTSVLNHKLSTPTSIAVDKKNRIWIGTMKGLLMLEDNAVKFLDSRTGLPSNEILSLYYDNTNNVLNIGTSDGFSQLDINLYDGYTFRPPNVKINSVQAGDSVFTNYNNLIFEPGQNDVYINYRVINYSSPGSITYKYVLNGDSKETKNDFLDFSSLKNGIYKLEIKAKTQNSDWGKTYFITFRILPRFVETVWFNIIVISAFAFITALILVWRQRLNKKKNKQQLELTERINELKHQALSAMMNPHFIFNSLNSVQYLINCQRNEEANNYIAMMAKLIRKNLDTAGSGFILLSEEINRLKLYLDLEKLRFRENFSYEIITGTDINTLSIMIPNMIVQPFVENSLWHGIINSGKKGLLTILFSFENIDIDSNISTSLIIKVTDNGIGINEAKKNKNEDHISKGIQIIEERLKLLSAKMQLPKPIMFEDLGSRSKDSHGTEVIISLPPSLYKIITPE